MASILIAQSNETSLEAIEFLLKMTGGTPNKLTLTTNPAEAIVEALTRKIDVVLAGQHFYQRDNSYLKLEALRHAQSNEEHVRAFSDTLVNHASGIVDGNQLAKQLYRVSPKTLTFRYSTTPSDERGMFVGDVPKMGDASALRRLLQSPKLGDIIDAKDWAALREELPGVRFYDALQTR